ncbi:MAG: GDYXXLXY domain-containing protein [Alphaproteobacteria bacterium]|nr:GDYXXLXY domain-containing protein [Alphaproteobacteria bacterium]
MIWARILLLAAAQTIALGYMIVDRQAMLNASRVVTLKVVPVDPMDPLRGEFVILNYAISRLKPAELDGEDKFNNADTIYVTLQNKGEDWAAVAIGHRPVAVQGGVVIKGTVNYANEFTVDAKTTTELNITYGIESFFVPQGMGRDIEDTRQKGDLTADIAIDPKGRAAIKAMRRKGEVFYVEGIL